MPQLPPNTALQSEIQSLFNALVADGKERGLQATAYHHGKLVLDAFAGTLAPNGPPVTAETLFPVYSTGKGPTATVIHLLAQRGKFHYDDPIAKFWPEFAHNGKDKTTIRQALNHTAGLANLPDDISPAIVYDWDAACRFIEQVAPAHPPGKETNYHAVTYGWILGELAHRVDGRPFNQILHEEILQPLGITTFFFGIPDSVESRVATIEEIPPAPGPEPRPALTPVPGSISPLGEWMNRHDARRASIPASNGIANTRAVARHYAALVPGGIDGIEILSPKQIALATDLAKFGTGDDPEPTQKSLGYGVGGTPDALFGPRNTAFGHGGYGGSFAFADPEPRFAIAFARNRFHDPATPPLIAKEVRRILGIE